TMVLIETSWRSLRLVAVRGAMYTAIDHRDEIPGPHPIRDTRPRWTCETSLLSSQPSRAGLPASGLLSQAAQIVAHVSRRSPLPAIAQKVRQILTKGPIGISSDFVEVSKSVKVAVPCLHDRSDPGFQFR